MTTSIRPLPIILVLGLLAAACSTASSSPSPSVPADLPGSAGIVDATGDWRLTSGTNAGVPIPIVPDAAITLTVAGSQVSGRAACNQYGGEIVVKDGQVQFGSLMMTEMGCAEPIMASEAAYAVALGKVRAATREGDRLTLTGDGVELVFERP